MVLSVHFLLQHQVKKGEMYYVRKTGEKKKLLSTRSGIQPADIEFISGDNLLLVPAFEDN